MYSSEIQSYLEERQFRVTNRELNHILETSPQIYYVAYEDTSDPYNKKLRLKTTDGWSWLVIY